MADDNIVIRFTEEQFLHTTEPYEYLVSIESATERDHEIAEYKRFAQKKCGITAATFKDELRKAEAKLTKQDRNVDVMTEFPDQPIQLRCPGYLCTDAGVWVNGGFYGPMCVCPQPIMPVRRIVNYDTGERKTEIAFRDKGHWQSLIVPRSVLATANRIVQPLSERGVFVDSESAKSLVTYFTRMDAMNSDKLPETHSATRMGWIDNTRFLPYEDGLLFDGEAEFAQLYSSIREHGSMDKWLELALSVRAGRNVATRAALAASFASVLVKPLKTLPFFVHCWSDVSGTGKTVALMFAASVWADPNDGAYVKNMNSTSVGVESISGFLGSLPLCMDELCMKDSKSGYKGNLEEMVYQFCEGAGRTRGTRNGGVQHQKRWNCCAITTGETPLIKDNARAGASNRVLELYSGDMQMFDDPVSANRVIRENYGFAGPLFVQALQQDGAVNKAQSYYDQYYAELSSGQTLTDKQTMVAAILLTADRIATDAIFHDGHCLRASDLAPMAKSKEDVDTNLRAYNWLMGTIVENNARFEPTKDEHYNGPIWGKLDENGVQTTACIIASRFSELLNGAGFDDKSFKNWAARHGLIETSAGKMSKTVRLSSISAPVRCVCIKMRDLGSVTPDGYTEVDVEGEDLPF